MANLLVMRLVNSWAEIDIYCYLFMPLKEIACNVVNDLVLEIIQKGDIEANYRLIDKIERRFKIIGHSDYIFRVRAEWKEKGKSKIFQ